MKLLLVFLFIQVSLLSAQDKNILVLEKAGGKRSYLYGEGDKIELTLENGLLLKGKISFIDDSLLRVGKGAYFRLSQINTITRFCRGFYQMFNLFFLKTGVPYLAIVSINRSINKEYPVVDQTTLIISGSLLTAGLVSAIFIKKKYKVDNYNWRLKLLDYTD
jgi:hypothetical protein